MYRWGIDTLHSRSERETKKVRSRDGQNAEHFFELLRRVDTTKNDKERNNAGGYS